MRKTSLTSPGSAGAGPSADSKTVSDAGERLRAAWASRSVSMAAPATSELSKAKALAHYCAQGAWAMAAQAVAQGARSDMKDSSVKSEFLGLSRKCLPIQMAAFAGEAELLEAMLRSGANPEASNGGDPCRPLAMALWAGRSRCAELLIKAGASLTRLCSLPARPAPMAYAPLLVSVLAVSWQARAPIRAGSREGEVSDEERARCVRVLAQAGADLNETSAAGESALTAAARINAAELIAELLALGADPMRADKNRAMPAGAAMRNHAAQALGALIDGGAKLEERELQTLRSLPAIARDAAHHSYWDDDGRSEEQALAWEGCLARLERRELSEIAQGDCALASVRSARL